ncbi:hypothetical protein TIFTF001_022422 [Ficus carica]|uniref:Squalene cyclase N-terminal domain-containing protein n=1 Tax=Ficus carica TaxID=3494 RepID=A0AA88DBP8_FICCA|nr:hypothetical protein TIFTF001_022422 [Ficus carica]
MWKLKIAEGGNPWLRTLNNHVGRQVWEFDPDLGSPEDLAQIEGPSTMFGSVLSYVTLRLLGEEANDGQGAMEGGRRWILDHGGATAITSWGKMWLSVLGVFEWSGNNPLPPEICLLPYILPIHPGSFSSYDWVLSFIGSANFSY